MKTLKVVIAKDGSYSLETSGFTGESCVNATKEIELILGGTEVKSGKKDEFYMDDFDSSVNINL